MNEMIPTVSVIMPVYNGAEFLAESIESILNQTFTDLEFIIINDGSTDNTEEIICTYTDPRIRYIRNEQNLQLIRTLNKGLNLARGKYMARMDADDIAQTDRLEKQVAFMEQNQDIGICGSWFESFGSSNNPVRYPEDDFSIRYTALFQCPFCHPTVVIRSSLIRQNDLKYDLNYPHAEDYEFWLRASRLTRLANLPHHLLRYRQHEMSISKIESETQNAHSVAIRRLFFNEAGLAVADVELDLFRMMNYQYNQFTLDQIERIGFLLCDLIEACKVSGYLEHSRLTELLSEKWYHLCTNHSHLGKGVRNLFWNINLLSKRYFGTSTAMKFFIKTAFSHTS